MRQGELTENSTGSLAEAGSLARAWGKKDSVVVGATTVVAVTFLCLYALNRPLWLDDTHSTYFVFGGPAGVIEGLRTDSHPPLYFLLLALWTGLAGFGEASLRLPSLIAYLAGGAVLYAYGRRTGDPRLAVLGTTLYFLSPVVWEQAQAVRPYALAGFLASLSTALYLGFAAPTKSDSHLSQPGSPRSLVTVWTGFIVVNALGTLTHYWFFLLLVAEGVGVLLFAEPTARRRMIGALGASVLPFAFLWAPVLLQQMQGSPTAWIGGIGAWWLVIAPLLLAIGQQDRELGLLFYSMFLISCVVRTEPQRGVIRRGELKLLLSDRRLALTAVVPFVVMVLAFAISQVRPFYQARYSIVAIPALALFLGLVLSKLGDRRLIMGFVVALALGTATLRVQLVEAETEGSFVDVADHLVANTGPGDEIVYVTLSYAPITHYLRTRDPSRSYSETVFPAEVGRHPGWRNTERMLAGEAELREEVRALVSTFKMQASENPGRRMWVLSHEVVDSQFRNILLEGLEGDLRLERTVPLEAYWISETRVYVLDSDQEGRGGGPIAAR